MKSVNSGRCLRDQLVDSTTVIGFVSVLRLRCFCVCGFCVTVNGDADCEMSGGQRPGFGVVAQRRCSIAWYENVPDCLAFACCGTVVDTFLTCEIMRV